MAAYLTGSAITLTVTFTDAVTGVPVDVPPTGSLVAITTPWNGVPITYTLGGANPQDAQLTHVGAVGSGQYTLWFVPPTEGPYAWKLLRTGGGLLPQERAGGLTVVDPSRYPYGFGYCDLTDVQAHINAGQWDASLNGAQPTVTQANELILYAATQLDMLLAKRGYKLPIQPAPGVAAVGQQAWRLLQQINAALATALIERTRYSQEAGGSGDAGFWMQYGDELLIRINNGDDNLTQFGVASNGWTPDPQPSKGVVMGGLTAAVDGAPQFAAFTTAPTRW